MTTFSRLLLYGKGTKQAAIGIELRGLAEAHQSLKKLTCRLVLKYILEPKNNLNFLGTFFFFQIKVDVEGASLYKTLIPSNLAL